MMPESALFRRVCSSVFLLTCILGLAATGSAQTRGPGTVYQSPPVLLGNDPMQGSYSGNPATEKFREKQRNQLNIDRQKALISDTQRLVKLAAELNAEINSTHQTELTPAQLRTVAEIEKLARSVRDKMSGPIIGVSPDFPMPSSSVLPMP